MGSGALGVGIGQVQAGLAALHDDEASGLPDQQVRAEVQALLTCLNQLTGALLSRLGVFDARELSQVDAQRASSTWLVDFGLMSKGAALRWLAHARALTRLPALAEGMAQGRVSVEQLARIADLARHVGIEPVREFDEILAELCAHAGPVEVGKACDRIWAMIDPDGPEPDPADEFDKREITFSQLGARRRGVADRGRGVDASAGRERRAQRRPAPRRCRGRPRSRGASQR
jgi:hypothetical protein